MPATIIDRERIKQVAAMLEHFTDTDIEDLKGMLSGEAKDRLWPYGDEFEPDFEGEVED